MNSENKYNIKRNNYVGLLFFALVLASILYIVKHETETFKEIEPNQKNIMAIEPTYTEISEETKQISNLREYLNQGDPNTFKVYQSMYNFDNEVNIDQINNENLLYMAYKYIIKTTDTTNYLSYITCDQAAAVSLDKDIIQCGGAKVNASYYTVNSLITKDLLKSTIRKLYNININSFTNFYTEQDNLCYFINDEYLCISKINSTNNKKNYSETKFIKALKYEDKIEIIENYKYVIDGIFYKGFTSPEIGEEEYISTFTKINGEYYWIETKPYTED